MSPIEIEISRTVDLIIYIAEHSFITNYSIEKIEACKDGQQCFDNSNVEIAYLVLRKYSDQQLSSAGFAEKAVKIFMGVNSSGKKSLAQLCKNFRVRGKNEINTKIGIPLSTLEDQFKNKIILLHAYLEFCVNK